MLVGIINVVIHLIMRRPITWQFILSMSIAASYCGAWQHFPRHNKQVSNNRIRCMKCMTSSFDIDDARFAIASTSTIVVTGTLLVFGNSVEEATAMDIPSSFIVHHQHANARRDAPIYHNSIEIAYQRLFNRDSKVMQYQTLLSSSDVSISKVITITSSPSQKKGSELKATNIQRITKENKIDVELVCTDAQRPLDSTIPKVKIDRDKLQKVKVYEYQPPFLQYLPSSMQPLVGKQFTSLQVLKSIPNNQLFIASVFAGSLTESVRVGLLYPLSTIKARVQARTSNGGSNKRRSLSRKLKLSWLTFIYEAKRGDLYSGILPSLLITVPASGVYSGAKEVSRRAFSILIQVQLVQNLLPSGDDGSYYSVLVVNLLAAFVADVSALVFRTPADVLALRLQVFGDNNVKSDFGNWLKDSWALLPSMIITDIPFLMSRIFLNAAITTQGENLGQYEFETIAVACLCAFLTTPFDVARTRILLPTIPLDEEDYEKATDEDDDSAPIFQSDKTRRLITSSKFREQRSQKLSVLGTMREVAKEGNGGYSNLYAGWIERTAFLGIGRAWLDPIRVIGYLGIRDALLLKLFD